MQEATLCFALTPTQVLLGLKRRSFGAGKLTGIGGKLEPGETARMAAAREVQEECGLLVAPEELVARGAVIFRFPAKPNWNFRVSLFVFHRWQGTPTTSDEIEPRWFARDAVPYDHMWDDASHWLPHVLAGRSVRAEFVFAADNEMVERAVVDVV